MKKFELGEIVWDRGNKRYGVVIATWDDDPHEVRLDSDGVQPVEDLFFVGSLLDKGKGKQMVDAIESYQRLCRNYPENNYPSLKYRKNGKVINFDF